MANGIFKFQMGSGSRFCRGIGTFLVNAIERNPESQFYGVELVTEVEERWQKSEQNELQSGENSAKISSGR